MTDSHIEDAVMLRVRTVHAVRPLLSGAMLALVLVVLSLYGIGREVWVAMVFQNVPHQSAMAALHFFVAAFANTRIVVQSLIVVAFAATLYLARETARLISSSFVAAAQA